MAWRLAFGGALYALAEIGLALILGRFLDWGRAEALLFFAFRPWCLLALALAAHRQDWKLRWGLYGGGLALASLSEGLMLAGLGAPNPLPELGRGMLGGLLLVILYEVLIQGGRWIRGKYGVVAGTLVALPFLLLPNGLAWYDQLVLAEEKAAPGPRPGVLVMTGLPLIWGEMDRWYDEPRPTQTYQRLQREFDILPVDVLDAVTLSKGKLLFVAQPRRLEPIELVRLDAWVRGGGRALILTDPLLLWPSDIPLGDARRPPPVGLLGPLLGHWGLDLTESGEDNVSVRMNGGRKWTVAAPGRFKTANPDCRLSEAGLIVDCRIGKGRVRLVADADMLHDTLWTGPGPKGADRHRRIADNPVLIAGWLDELAGIERDRSGQAVAWRIPDRDPIWPVFLALLPIALASGVGFALRGRRKS